MGAPRPAELHLGQRQPEWAITCPVPACHARPGSHCTSPRGHRTPGGSHPSRLDAWLGQQYDRSAATPNGSNTAS
jgi:hypothetical protein